MRAKRISAGPSIVHKIVGQALGFRVARATGWTDVDAGGALAIRSIIRAYTSAILTNTCGDLGP